MLTRRSEWPTIPQVYVKGEFVGGCDIVLSSGCSACRVGPLCADGVSVHQSGELEQLLVKENLVSELPPLPEDQK